MQNGGVPGNLTGASTYTWATFNYLCVLLSMLNQNLNISLILFDTTCASSSFILKNAHKDRASTVMHGQDE